MHDFMPLGPNGKALSHSIVSTRAVPEQPIPSTDVGMCTGVSMLDGCLHLHNFQGTTEYDLWS
jgi:hypothetical protein